MDLCWQPHAGQSLVKKALFGDGKELIFLECGRKFGKTEMLAYLLYRFALSHPNSACYFIAPFQKQAKELVWANNRLQNFFLPLINEETGLTHNGHNREQAYQILNELNEKYLNGKPNDSEMRIKFNNGSFIKLDGADNHQAYRGVNPHIIVYDEFKDHHPKFHTGMDPNLATYQAPLIIVGTPCEGDEDNRDNFNNMADYAKTADNQAHFALSTHYNPHISREWLDRKRKELFAKGEEDKWYREYEAKRVQAGQRNIFPMLDDVVHKVSESEIRRKYLKYRKDWEYFLSFDPASASIFAVLLVIIHKTTKQVIILDEIYESEKKKMSTKQIFPRALKLLDKWNILYDECRMIYDNAATWFQNEVANEYQFGLEPCRKDFKKKKEERISLIKDMLLMKDCLLFSEGVPNTFSEFKEYRVDEKGKIVKNSSTGSEDDHEIDNLRYILSNNYYDTVPTLPISPSEAEVMRRGTSLEKGFQEDRNKDPFEHIYSEYYE